MTEEEPEVDDAHLYAQLELAQQELNSMQGRIQTHVAAHGEETASLKRALDEATSQTTTLKQ